MSFSYILWIEGTYYFFLQLHGHKIVTNIPHRGHQETYFNQEKLLQCIFF